MLVQQPSMPSGVVGLGGHKTYERLAIRINSIYMDQFSLANNLQQVGFRDRYGNCIFKQV